MIVKAPPIRTYGPADHGRPMSLERFLAGPWLEGYRYELIDGRVYVSPQPNEPHDQLLEWLSDVLHDYKRAHPDVINRVSSHARVFVPGHRAATCPEPDFVAYDDYPVHTPRRRRRWQDISPILVVEVVSGDVAKDLGRNVALYEQVPSVREYWVILDADIDEQFLFRVYRKRGAKWRKPLDLRLGATYTTRLLPGFSLPINLGAI
jgi:Uma2 family endonuclease